MYFGWIKLHRQILEWEWYKDINTKTLWFHLLLTASIAPCRIKGFELNPGQIMTTLPRLASETGLSEKEVRTAISHLEKSGEISQYRTNKFRIITIEKWGIFQSGQQPAGSQAAAERQPSGSQAAALIKEGEKSRKKNVYRVRKNRFCNYEMREDAGGDW